MGVRLTFWKRGMCQRASSFTGGLYFLSRLLLVSYSFPKNTCRPEECEGEKLTWLPESPELRQGICAQRVGSCRC